MKRDGFTIIELIIVMTILSLMFLMTKNYFSSDNKIYFEGESCINNFYAKVKEVQNTALLSRTRSLTGSLGSANFVPDRYNIIFKEPRILAFNTPTHYFNSIELASGFVKTFRNTPLNTGSIAGTLNGSPVNVTLYDLLPQTIMYRGTGSVDVQPLDNSYHQYKIRYPAIWYGLALPNMNQYQWIWWCTSRDFFVSYRIEGNTGNTADTLRVGFQTTATQIGNNIKPMILKRGARWNGTNPISADLYTWAIDLMICNKSMRCKETHRLFFDTRANNIFLQKCSSFNSALKCMAWQGGNVN